MDYSRLRAAALRDGEDEEAVTVDTRALIDKVLARYSGEWTTLRELIQNAADAQATTVKIKWETLPSTTVPLPSTSDRSELLKHTVTNHTLRRLLVQNNGQPFTKTDWARLKRIAEGNPDETKIGAFGVGFYSVFADCEEPFVSSGKEAMAFYWKGNSLFTRKLQIPEAQASDDTTFVLDYRNSTTALPNLLSIGQFLATSLTFVALQNIEFWIDDWRILSLQKKASPTTPVSVPRDLETRTKEGLMNVTSVDRSSAQIDASFMSVIGWKPQASAAAAKSADTYGMSSADMPSLRNFFSRLTASSSQAGLRGRSAREEKAVQEAIAEDLTAVGTSSIFLRVTSAVAQTKISAGFATELERATKKQPPKTVKMSILTSSYDDTLASDSSRGSTLSAKAADVFASVLPSKKPGGRVFIGFPTTQTTGGGMHISAPSLIPTVEREAVDLNARWVRTWNIEMLRIAGIMTRLSFSNEMADLDAKFKSNLESQGGGSSKRSSIPSAADVARFVPEALHILKTYTFGDSTPSAYVGQIIEEAFWTSYKRASIEVFSSRGVLSTTKVRNGSDELGKFVDGIPIIVKDMKDSPFIKKLIDFSLVKDITVQDILQELEAKSLNKDQLMHFISWAGSSACSGELDPPDRRALLDVAVATVSDEEAEGQGAIIALSTITNYLSGNKIPASLPIPPTTIPFAFTRSVPVAHLQALGWEPLDLVPWLKFLIESGPRSADDQNITKSPKFAAQVLTILSKNWDNQSQGAQTAIISFLGNRTVIPTKMGMKKPGESFFPSVKLFDDLPVVQGCPAVKDKFLSALGVRKTVDLETIFTRLLNQSSEADDSAHHKKWSHVELIKYLASVKDDIPESDMKKLRESRICPAEAGPAGRESTVPSTQMYKVSELFEPKDSLRTLGLPLIQWPGPPGSFRVSSPEARFLASLGLRPYPSVPELVDMMASTDASLRESARAYFISNHHLNHYASFDLSSTSKAILPVMGNEKQLVPPRACYTNEAAAVLGFTILRRDFHQHASKFGVARDPPITECVSRLLAKPPQNSAAAITLFEYFATRLSDLGENSLSKLRDSPIVPVTRRTGLATSTEKGGSGSSSNVVHVQPRYCYLGSSSAYSDIFDFVDFGSNANAFLFKCGSRNEPTKPEIARLVCAEPARLLSVMQSSERYLNLLRSLAEDLAILKKDKELFNKMKTSPFLLASREITAASDKRETGSSDLDDEAAPIKQYQLATPRQIVVLDDYISYRLFKDSLICAPEEDVLETFYLALGAQMLSSIVQEDLRVGTHSRDQQKALTLRNLVLERSKIFLYEYQRYNRDAIKRDHKWLEKNFSVEMVQSLALRRSLRDRPQSHTEKRSAASTHTAGSGYVMYVSTDRPIDLYQVGQAVCQLLLNRPSQQAYFFFEPFLKLDLLDLKARGYNVDRILRAKAAEARIAEEERRKALEAEQAKIRGREQEWNRQNRSQTAVAAAASRERARTPEPKMPGAFTNDSPEDSASQQQQMLPRRPKTQSLFSNFTRRFGFDQGNGEEQDRHLQDFLPETETPKEPAPTPAGDSASGRRPQQQQQDDGRVTSPAAVQQNLLNAIKSTRPHGSSSLFTPPKTNEVKEQATYCDSAHAQDLALVAEAPNGMRVFAARDVTVPPAEFLAANHAAIAAFASLLADVAAVYGLSNRAVHVYYDEVGPTIAFNSSGSLFCNLRFFVQLHAGKLRAAATATSGSGSDRAAAAAAARVEATVWWWVVFAHELAHNLESSHNAQHSYYTESFVQAYFPKMMARAAAWTAAAEGNSSSGSGGDVAVTTSPSGRRSLPPPPSYQQSVGGSLLN